jgi:hypothetical protein
MKYICLGYFDESKWETMSEREQRAFMDGCLPSTTSYGRADTFSVAKRSKSARNAVTLRRIDGKVSVADAHMPRRKSS